jgi:hypothetical protein
MTRALNALGALEGTIPGIRQAIAGLADYYYDSLFSTTRSFV